MFVVERIMSAIDFILHCFGRQSFVGRDDHSRNWASWAGLVGLRWYEFFDPGFMFIRVLEGPGLALHVRVPTREKIVRRAGRAGFRSRLIVVQGPRG